jgi:hypothetical protein
MYRDDTRQARSDLFAIERRLRTSADRLCVVQAVICPMPRSR